jgi:hypothetical protein
MGIGGIAPPLSSALRVGEWLASRSGRITPRKGPRYPLNKGMGGPKDVAE